MGGGTGAGRLDTAGGAATGAGTVATETAGADTEDSAGPVPASRDCLAESPTCMKPLLDIRRTRLGYALAAFTFGASAAAACWAA